MIVLLLRYVDHTVHILFRAVVFQQKTPEQPGFTFKRCYALDTDSLL